MLTTTLCLLLCPNNVFRSTACASLVAFANGQRPVRGCVNPEVFKRPTFIAKWERLMAATSGQPLAM